MKVLIHAPNLATPGGKQTYFRSIRDYFKSDVVFFFYGSQGLKESKFRWLIRVISDYIKFYRLVKQDGFDLVHLNPSLNLKSFFRDCGFVLICRWLGTKTIVFWRGWNWDFEKKVVRRLIPFFNHTYGRADAMIVLANEFRDRIITYGFTGPIYLSTTVVNDQIFELTTKYLQNDPVTNKESETCLLFLARVESVKGIYETIDSFTQLLPIYPNLRLLVAGVGSELESVKGYVRERNIRRVDFLGWVTGKEKSAAFHRSQIYLLPSSHGEGMPNSLLEAMASGLAVITSDVGGIKDFFLEDRMGYYVEPHNTQDLKQKLDTLLSQPSLIAEMGTFNTGFAQDHFSARLVTEKLENIYQQTLSGGKVELAR